jgi:glycosyltransferase involved in cell wall biosynthesis
MVGIMVSGNPKVSVVIPTYNCDLYINEAIDSVLEQTFSDYEIIIVDNSSTDRTVELIESYSDSRVQLVSCQNNGIIAKSRNIGVSISQGEFLAFLDGDDLWYPQKLEICIPLLSSAFDLVYHGELWFDNQGNSRSVKYRAEDRSSYSKLLAKGNNISTSSVVVRKSVLERVGGFCENPEYISAEDYDLWMRLALNGASFKYVDQILGGYRIHALNTVKQEVVHERAVSSVLVDHYNSNRSGTLKSIRLRRRLALVYAESGYRKSADGKLLQSAIKFLKSMFCFPLSARSVFLFFLSVIKLLGWNRGNL